jgi:histone acetyltransferase (RNA polymerase elongator complex component)
VNLIVPLFLMARGCSHRCIFCNERVTAGNYSGTITERDMSEAVALWRARTKGKPTRTQLAFYGGSFTALPRPEQLALLEAARGFIRRKLIDDIRISTRPDGIDGEQARVLEEYGVRTVEIGAQSLDDAVLARAGRGHTASHVARAVAAVRERGMEVGLHLMAGLPGDTGEGFARTVAQAVDLRPDMVRIHPTLVLAGTGLAEEFRRGAYRPLTLAEAVETCKSALLRFTEANIPVIRLGLHPTPQMEAAGGVVAGPYHPAFRSLVEEALFFEAASSLLREIPPAARSASIAVAPQDVSSVRGRRNENIRILKERFGLAELVLVEEPGRRRGSIALAGTDRLTEQAGPL